MAYGAVACVFIVIIYVFLGRYFRNDVNVAAATLNAREIQKACEIYFVEHGQYPPSLEDLLTTDQDGKGPYLTSDKIRDPWGNVFRYDPSGALQRSSGPGVAMPDIYCIAPDGRSLGNWK
jgi:hypothetical protein